jgi:hypothetical protein
MYFQARRGLVSVRGDLTVNAHSEHVNGYDDVSMIPRRS